MLNKKIISISVIAVVAMSISGCSNNDPVNKKEDTTNISKISKDIKQDEKNQKIKSDEISNEDKSKLEKEMENLFTGIWVYKEDGVNKYCKFKPDRLEDQVNTGHLNMHFYSIDKIDKNYKDNSINLHLSNIGDEKSEGTVKFINNNEVKVDKRTYKRVDDKKEVAKDLARTYQVDFEAQDANGLDKFLDLSRNEFFSLFGIHIFDSELTSSEKEEIQSNMNPDEAKNIISENIKGTYLDNDARFDVNMCKAGNLLGYAVAVSAGEPTSENYRGREEFFVSANTKQIGVFVTGFGYFDMGDYDQEFFDNYYKLIG